MTGFFRSLRSHHLQVLKKQQATDKLRLLIETNYWNIYKPLPGLSDIAELINHKEHIVWSAIVRLIHCGIILRGLNGELYIKAADREIHG